MLHVVSPDPVDDGMPIRKNYRLMANFDISGMNLKCREGLLSPLQTLSVRASPGIFPFSDPPLRC